MKLPNYNQLTYTFRMSFYLLGMFLFGHVHCSENSINHNQYKTHFQLDNYEKLSHTHWIDKIKPIDFEASNEKEVEETNSEAIFCNKFVEYYFANLTKYKFCSNTYYLFTPPLYDLYCSWKHHLS